MSEEVLGKYSVVGRLGMGGMADVYLCRLVGIGGFDKQVVVKRIRADVANNHEFVEMFLDEARVAANLTHPNIVQIFEIDMLEGLPYISMEYVAGQTLAAIGGALRSRGTRCYGSIASICADVCAGLHHAHNARDADGKVLEIVHRDISPQNIIVSNTGIAKVFDFGVAKAKGRLGNTETGTVKGKISYMAPEQLRARPVDGRADVYALGVCLYEACVGERPFVAMTEGELFAARVGGIFAVPSEVIPDFPYELERIILRAMAPDPEDRPTADELEDELRAFAFALGKDQHAVSTWVCDLFPDSYEPPIRRSSSRFEVAVESSKTSITVASGSGQRRPSRLGATVQPEPAPPPPRTRGWMIATIVVAVVSVAVIVFIVVNSPSRQAAVAAASPDAGVVVVPSPDVPTAPSAGSSGGSSAAAPIAVAVSVAPVEASRPRETPAPSPKRPPPRERPAAKKPARPSGQAIAATPPATVATLPPPVATPPVTTPPVATPPVTPPPVTTPPIAPPPAAAAIAAPRLPATYSVRSIKELGKVLAVIEGEALGRGGAPPPFRGVTNKMAEQAFATFVPGDLIELHPRDIYYAIVRGMRAGKSPAAIAVELKGLL